MRTYKWDDLRELYRVENKYWKTGVSANGIIY